MPAPLLPTDADRAWWAAALRGRAPLADRELSALGAQLSVVRVEAGAAYLRAGDPATRVGLVRSGVLREFFVLDDGGERTRAFAIEGDFAGSLSDLLRGGASRTSVVAASSARVLSVPWRAVQAAAEASPGVREVLHRVTERLYLAKAEREFELLALDAEERYRRFLERFPRLPASIAQRHVASYLGITPEHLSRVRARLGMVRRRPA